MAARIFQNDVIGLLQNGVGHGVNTDIVTVVKDQG